MYTSMLAIMLTKTEFFIHTFIYIVIYYVTHIIVDFLYGDSVVRLFCLQLISHVHVLWLIISLLWSSLSSRCVDGSG